MNYWQDLWDFKYPFPKLDQISVPRIVQDGMENIGLITYWPGYLLAVPEVWTTAHYQKNCMVIAHELSHLWFGDTVTLPWWSETYNNEGFARYLQYTGCNAIFPQWNSFENGSYNFFSFAYSIIKQDSYGTLRSEIVIPKRVPGTVSSISNAFAGPTYPKGASLNRMFNIYMGDDNWNGALSYHLNKYQFTNPTTGDLLDSFDIYTNNSLQLKEKFMPWLTLSGFPIITMNYTSNGEISLTQKPCSRFLPLNQTDYSWFITLPISMNGDLSYFQYVNFSSHSYTYQLDDSSNFEFLQGNANHTSYFVVNYSTMNQWQEIFNFMNSNSYNEVYRGLFIQDIFILTQMSHQSIDIPLAMINTWNQIINSSYWTTLFPLLFEITVALDEQQFYSQLTNEIVSDLNFIVENLNSSSDLSFQSSVLFYDTLYGDSNAINYFINQFNSNENSFKIQEQKAAYWAIGRYGTGNDYEKLYNLYPSIKNNKIQANNVLLGLTGPQNLHFCNVTLTLFDDSFILSDRLSYARNMLAYNPFCRHLAWDYIRVTGTQLFKQSGSAGADAVLNSFSGLLSSKSYLAEATNFLDKALNNNWISLEQYRDAIVSIEINIDIVEKNSNWSP